MSNAPDAAAGGLTHLDADGQARMVDVSAKPATVRVADAEGWVVMRADAFAAVRDGAGPKGDALAVARLAGIMAAKRTADLIPLCHPLPVSGVTVDVAPHGLSADGGCGRFRVTAAVKTTGPTGVEMEALTAVSVACLTLYDMAKALDRSIAITDVRLLAKSGGASGEYAASSARPPPAGAPRRDTP